MAKTNLQVYLDDVRKKLSPNRRIPKITNEMIEYNIEMMPTDDEDASIMYLAGLISHLDLADVLLGKRVL